MIKSPLTYSCVFTFYRIAFVLISQTKLVSCQSGSGHKSCHSSCITCFPAHPVRDPVGPAPAPAGSGLPPGRPGARPGAPAPTGSCADAIREDYCATFPSSGLGPAPAPVWTGRPVPGPVDRSVDRMSRSVARSDRPMDRTARSQARLTGFLDC